MRIAGTAFRLDLSQLAFVAAIALLAAAPISWLLDTWFNPAFDSDGFTYFAIVAVLAAWSALSPLRAGAAPADQRLCVLLLAATALVRLVGQVLAIDTIGAFALVIDLYALARLMRLDRRVRAISPLWLAGAFAFALPLERILQRCIGFGLQELSAHGACGALTALFGDVRCEGVRIVVSGADVLVDLPCSGARALIAFGFLFAITAALARPRWPMALIGGAAALFAAFVGNVLRITLLASGVALGPERLGVDVMAQPWHDIVGLVALAAAAPVLIVWARLAWRAPKEEMRSPSRTPRPTKLPAAGAFAFLLIACLVVRAPHQPVDVAPGAVSIAAPERVGALRATPLTLTPGESTYFEQFGGAAVKAAYGPFALMLARTTSPLRHLHAPDECMRGLGYRVTYLGMRFTQIPTARYRAVAPDGRAYRVDVSFFSNRGHAAGSVAEAVWLWLGDRSLVWTAVQRVIPEDADPAASAAFEAGVLAALDLSRPPSSLTASAQGAVHAR